MLIRQLFETEMDNFFSLFRRYLNDKAQGNAVYDCFNVNPWQGPSRWLQNR